MTSGKVSRLMILSRLMKWSSNILLVALGLAPVASAQVAPRFDPGADPEQIVSAELTVAVTLEGFVKEPDGAPADGAVVVSSAGGRAVTDSSGSYRLAARVPVEAQSIELTAIGRTGRELLASVRVSLSGASGPVGVGPLLLAQGGACSASWLPTFGGEPGVGGGVSSLWVFDDGGVTALCARGYFKSAGGVAADGVAKWDGSSWSPLGSGSNSWWNGALTDFDDGSGPALHSVRTSGIARWDGSSWTVVGGGVQGALSSISALTVFDDGGGAALYVGWTSGAIKKWDGLSWTDIGIGMNNTVSALTVFDDGGGPALYAGGQFTSAYTNAGSVALNHIAKWDGSSWAGPTIWGALGSGLNGGVSVLMVFDDGSGSALYAGGPFTSAGSVAANNIAKWDGSSWATLGSGLNGGVSALTGFDDGSGFALYVGGSFTSAGSVAANYTAKWDGSSWGALASGMNFSVGSLTAFDDGGGPVLYAGGWFTSVGGVPASDIAKWDGSNWLPLGSGMNDPVWAETVFDNGGGPALYAGGEFTGAGGVAVNKIGKWDGSNWSALGTGMDLDVKALTGFDDGSGPALYAAGEFTSAGGVAVNHIAKWDGSNWSALGSGLSGASSVVHTLAVFDDGGGPALYAGGKFTSAGGVPANHIAKWDGSSWSALGIGVNGPTPWVRALTVFDDGGGPALYVGGKFTSAGAAPARRIAKWDGSSWAVLGTGVYGKVFAMAGFDDGGGPALYAGGNFTIAGGVAVNFIAKWDGSSWSALGSGVGWVHTLTDFDDGSGPALYAGGSFSYGSGNIAKWDGSSWTVLDSGMNDEVRALTVFDDGGGPALYAGGDFGSVIDSGDSFIGKWGRAANCTGTSYCSAGTSASNCEALISASGNPSATAASGFTLTTTGVEGQQDGLFFFGTSGRQANSWGNGTSYQCVLPPTQRAGLLTGSGTLGMCDGLHTQDLNARWTDRPAQNPGAGAVVQAQLWYWDPLNTSNQGTSLSDAIEFTVGP